MTANKKTFSFRDNKTLVVWIKYLLIFTVVIHIAGIASSFKERDLLHALRDGVYAASHEDAEHDADINDTRQQIIACSDILLFCITAAVVGCWINLSHKNSLALGAHDKKFTPGGAVGYFFIPIYNLFRPYMAMKELYQTSASPRQWQSVVVPPLLPSWWTLWIVATILGKISYNISIHAKTIEQSLNANMLDIIFHIINIFLSLIFLKVVEKIYDLQQQAAAQQIVTV